MNKYIYTYTYEIRIKITNDNPKKPIYDCLKSD